MQQCPSMCVVYCKKNVQKKSTSEKLLSECQAPKFVVGPICVNSPKSSCGLCSYSLRALQMFVVSQWYQCVNNTEGHAL